MKILMIAPEPFLEPRGTPISIYERLVGLSKLGHTVDLLTYPMGQNVDIPNVRIHRIPKLPTLNEIKIGPSVPKIFLDLLLFFKAVLMLLGTQYDVIHTHEEAAYFSILLSKLFNTPHLYDMHSSLPKQLKISKFKSFRIGIRLFEWMETLVLRHSCAVIAIAKELDDHIRTKNPHAKVTIIENLALPELYDDGNGQSIEKIKAELNLEDKIPIVYTGNFEHYQGLELLLESAALLCCRNPKVKLILVGGRPQQIQDLSKKASEYNLNGKVVFTGRVPPRDVGLYLQLASVLVSPRSEGLPVPLKIYSYLYTGKPVVATNIAAHHGFSEYENMILVDPQPETFATGMLQALRMAADLPKEGLEARQKQIAKEKLELYLSLIAKAYQSIKPQFHMKSETELSNQ